MSIHVSNRHESAHVDAVITLKTRARSEQDATCAHTLPSNILGKFSLYAIWDMTFARGTSERSLQRAKRPELLWGRSFSVLVIITVLGGALHVIKSRRYASHHIDIIRSSLFKPAGVDACDFANLFEDMWEGKDAEALLRGIEKRGGADESVRQKFMQDLFRVFHSHGVKFWLEEGTLIQMVRNLTGLPDEPATLPFGDIDVGIRDTELFASGPLAQAMFVLKFHGFRIIRCHRPIFTLERDGDYVDIMIFASSAPACQVREPSSTHKCSDGIAPYVLHTHQQQWNFLEGGLVSLPGSSLLETVDYLEAMFGTTWYQHDVPNWRRTQSPNPGGGGSSANWERTDSRLKSNPKRFTFDRFGAVADPKMCAAPCSYTFQSVLASGKRLVRIDDYPYPDETPIALQRKWLEQAIMIFERSGVPYLLGVSPHRLAYDDVQEHIDFLNRIVKKGYICMHGFTHRTDAHTDIIRTSVWERGGEFAKYETEAELESEWLKGDAILQKLHRYTREHFIPPFNALTQMMVNVLMRKGTRFIHSFDVALCQRPARTIPHPDVGGNFGGCLEDMRVRQSAVFVVSEWKRTYADADELRIEPHGSQITLHWYFDAKKSTFPRSYEHLSEKLLALGDDKFHAESTTHRLSDKL